MLRRLLNRKKIVRKLAGRKQMRWRLRERLILQRKPIYGQVHRPPDALCPQPLRFNHAIHGSRRQLVQFCIFVNRYVAAAAR